MKVLCVGGFYYHIPCKHPPIRLTNADGRHTAGHLNCLNCHNGLSTGASPVLLSHRLLYLTLHRLC